MLMPEFNPIELAFNKMKTVAKWENIRQSFYRNMHVGCTIVSSRKQSVTWEDFTEKRDISPLDTIVHPSMYVLIKRLA